jgi:hypothetical protein
VKRISSLTILISVFATVFLLLSGCGHEESPQTNTGSVTGVIYVDYVKSYENLGELAEDADLIIVGTIDRTETVPDEATKDKEDPISRMWNTRSVLRIEKSLKNDFTDEITIIQTGAVGWAEEPGNPIFEPGERCFIFLREGEDGIYGLLHPDGRFKIDDDKVSSMNFILPTGQSRPPIDLKFWRIDLDDFISRVIEEIKSGFVIPDEEPVISMDLLWTMSGRHNELSIYKNGTVVYVKEWGLRMPMPEHPARRAWQFGKISIEDVESVFDYLNSVGFNDLEKYPEPLDPNTQSGVSSDLFAMISASNGNIDNTVVTDGYFTPEVDNKYKKLPPPLDEIYTKLIRIVDGETKEVYREEIERDIVYEYPDGDDQ